MLLTMKRALSWLLIAGLYAGPAVLKADVNVLLIGSVQDAGNDLGGSSDPFVPTAVKTELENILGGADLGVVNVTLEDRYATSGSYRAYNLASWFHWPYPAGVETATRWPNLRGEGSTVWDYVILIGDPYTLENTPGVYTLGVAKIGEEVAKGSAETILLMPWPVSGSSSVDHYEEVVYRTGRTGGYKVAPAGLAWQAAGAPTGGTHPSSDGAYIAAASIYSRIWGESASASSYIYTNDVTLADTVHTSVTNAIGAPHYSGTFSFQNPFLMLGDKRRDVHVDRWGTSTEQYFEEYVGYALNAARVSKESGPRPTPVAWKHGRTGLYLVDPAAWQLTFGFVYQPNTWGSAISVANDEHVGRMYSDDFGLANTMLGEGATARTIPVRTIWAQLHQEYGEIQDPLNDGAWHLNFRATAAVAAYEYTLYSGRCPVEGAPDFTANTTDFNAPAWGIMNEACRWMGYEAAWRLGRCATRAPGFKVVPASKTAVDVTPTSSQPLSVNFIMAPTSDVTVVVSTDDPYIGKVSPSVLTFTPANHAAAQTVTLLGETGPAVALAFNVILTTSSADPAYDELSDSWEFINTRPEGPVPSDIRILGNGITILSDDTTPAAADGTDFGVTTTSVARTFTVTNLSSSATLNLTNSPRVTLTSASGDYTLSQDAASGSLNPGTSTTFDITYTPSASGVHTATVTVASTDAAISAYTFALSGVCPGAPTIYTWPTATSIFIGQAVSNATLSGGSASVAGGFSYDDPSYVPAIGTVAVAVTFTPDDATNYTAVAGSVDIEVTAVPADVPVNLSATPLPLQVALIWTASAGATGYHVKRASVSGGPYTTVAAPTAASYSDTGLAVGSYYYVVSALKNGLESADSSEVSAFLQHVLPFAEDFESRTIGALDGQNLWQATNAVVQTGVAVDTQAASISSGAGQVEQSFDGAASNTWTDFQIQPVLFDEALTSPPTDCSTILYFDAEAHPVAYDGTTPVVLTNVTIATGTWIRVTVQSDYVAQQWDLYIGGAVVATNLGFYNATATQYERFRVQGAGASSALLDELAIGTASPFGGPVVTANHAVPHSWLASQNPAWTNDYEAAELADPDGDGFTTWQEYWSGTDPMNSNSYLRIDQIVFDGTNMVLAWEHRSIGAGIPAIAIETSTNLNGGPWLHSGEKIPVNGTNLWMDAALQSVFYRLTVTNAP